MRKIISRSNSLKKAVYILLSCFIMIVMLMKNGPTVFSSTTSLTPIDDTLVRSRNADVTHGNNTTLEVDGDPSTLEITYFKFDLSTIANSNISSAKLRVYVTDASSQTQNVRLVSTNAWLEETMTYNNRPSPSSLVTTISGAPSNAWRDIDITSAVNTYKGGLLSLQIDQTGTDGFNMQSKEASSNQPSLEITYATPTPLPTSPSGSTCPVPGSGGYATAALKPIVDTFVRSTYPSTSYQNHTILEVNGDSGNNDFRISYMKFDLSSLGSKSINAAYLCNYVRDSSVGPQTLRTVTSNNWSETTTWNTRPGQGSAIGTMMTSATSTWYSIDISNTVDTYKGNPLSLQLDQTNADLLTMRSKDDPNSPYIYVKYVNATPTPVPTNTPSPTPTRTPTPTPTRTPTPTPTRTPSPSPTSTPTPTPLPSCTSQCTKKEIGSINPIGNNFTTQTTVTQNQEYWVRITVNAANNPSTVKIKEIINQNYFTIANFITGNFKITSSSGGTETDITNSICADTSPNDGIPDCISNIQKNGTNQIISMDVQLDSISGANKRYIYFKAIPNVIGNNIKINSATSTTQYQTISWNTSLDVGPDTSINPPSPYFQIASGDIYSGGNIDNQLPSGKTFTTGANTLLFHQGGATYGSGSRGTNSWDVSPYTLNHDSSIYNTYYEPYSKYITPTDITSMNSISTSGYYIDNTSKTTHKLTLQGAGWDNQTLTGKNVIIFVPGDLYIKSNFLISKDGKSNLTFLVSGRIGIDPSVTNIEGIYFSDGVIDTSCTTTAGFQSDNSCTPNTADSSGGPTLTLSGIFYTTTSFSLDRYGTSGTNPGETFKTRPDLLLSATLALGKNIYAWKENNQ